MSVGDQVTVLIGRAAAGEKAAAEDLLPLIYDQLRRTAERAMQAERIGHTLQATALVHEAYLRLVGDQPVAWESRAHFYHAAARAMRQLLVEHARAKGRLKRGGSGQAGSAPRKVPLDVADLAAEGQPEDILAIDDALDYLEHADPESAAVVRLRFFAGLTGEQTAQALGVSARQVDRLWAYARAVMYERVTRGQTGP